MSDVPTATALPVARSKPLIGDGSGRYRILIVGNSGTLLPLWPVKNQSERTPPSVLYRVGTGKVGDLCTKLWRFDLQPATPYAGKDDAGR